MWCGKVYLLKLKNSSRLKIQVDELRLYRDPKPQRYLSRRVAEFRKSVRYLAVFFNTFFRILARCTFCPLVKCGRSSPECLGSIPSLDAFLL